jgi:hypothetical protein
VCPISALENTTETDRERSMQLESFRLGEELGTKYTTINLEMPPIKINSKWTIKIWRNG